LLFSRRSYIIVVTLQLKGVLNVAKPTRKGRPPISDYCVKCYKEGLRPPEAGAKEWGTSYCRRHLYVMQRASKTRNASLRAFKLGLWDEIPEANAEGLATVFAGEIAKANGNVPAKTHKQARIAATAFEYSCFDLALRLSRRLTLSEEDELIEAYGGSRTSSTTVRWSTLPGSDEIDGPIRLPDDKLRERMRAENKGGPTTEDEPLYQDYYRSFYGHEPPADAKVQESPDDMIYVKDPQLGYMSIMRSMMPVYQADLEKRLAGEEGTIQAGTGKRPVEELYDEVPAPEKFVLPDSDAIKSFSQLAAEANSTHSQKAEDADSG
jgi:hypothetical protein